MWLTRPRSEPGQGPHGDAERPFLSDYLKLGYVPNEKDSISASRTLMKTLPESGSGGCAAIWLAICAYDEPL